MNGKQKTVLWIGVILVALMGLFPPWFVEGYSYTSNYRLILRYGPIFAPPRDEQLRAGLHRYHLDFSRLLAQQLTVVLVAAGLVLALSDRRDGRDLDTEGAETPVHRSRGARTFDLNRAQRLLLVAGLIVMAFMGIVPPWLYRTQYGWTRVAAIYRPIFLPPRTLPYLRGWLPQVDLYRLGVQYTVVVFAVVAGLVLLRRRRPQERESEGSPSRRLRRGRQAVIVIALVLLAAMVLYPPWLHLWEDYHSGVRAQYDAGYGLVFRPPEAKRGWDERGIRIDCQRLWVQCAAVLFLAGACLVMMGGRQSTKGNPPALAGDSPPA